MSLIHHALQLATAVGHPEAVLHWCHGAAGPGDLWEHSGLTPLHSIPRVSATAALWLERLPWGSSLLIHQGCLRTDGLLS